VSDNLTGLTTAVNENLACILSEPSHDRAATALIHAGATSSYAALCSEASSAAASLTAAGVRPGDRVAIALPNAPSFVAAYFGALWIGAVAVPLNILLRAREIDERLEAVSPTALVFDEERARELGPLAGARGLAGVTFEDSLPESGVPSAPQRRGRRGDPVHLGDVGSLEGRRPDTWQHRPQPEMRPMRSASVQPTSFSGQLRSRTSSASRLVSSQR
jgi:acyl-CoA synthetase (AMP-forming)/AMP-acid ligase II